MTLLVLAVSGTVSAQQVALAVGSGSAAPGASITVPITLTTSGSAQPAALQWTMGYSASDISGVTVTAGASATAASKSVTCFSASSTTTNCVAYGVNENILTGGTLASATFTIASGSLDTSTAIQLSGLMATDAMGDLNAISASGTAGTITIPQAVGPTLGGLTCTPATVSAAGVSACTVTLSSAALTGGLVVGVSSNNSNMTVPASVTVASGATSVGFSATASGTVPSAQTAVLTASAAGVSKTFSLNLVTATWSITGSVGTAGSGATITLTGASAATTTANASGTYTFSGLANGSYTVTPALTGHTFSPTSAAVTVNGANATAANFELVAGGSGAAFITAYSGSDVRNNFSGWVGMGMTVGSNSLNVSSIGRLCLAGNLGTHTVKFASNGQDVPGGSVTVKMAGCTAGQFVYTALPATISLQAGVSYELASLEVAGGDTWYDNGPVSATSDATVTNAVYYNGNWVNFSGANTSYVPPNFEYTVASGISYITTYSGSDVRNNFSGWVGMRMTVGSNSLNVSSIGRLCLAGNLGTHTVKFASNGQDVPGGSVTVNMAGCTAGQFVYTALPATISLQASVSYELASLEVAGGDTWYDNGSVTATSDATVTNAVYYNGNWVNFSGANTSYVPPNFEYTVAPGISYITAYSGSDVRNNFSGWAGMQITVGSAPLTVTSVGRLCLTGNSGTHTVKFATAANGQDVPGGSATVNMAGCTAGQFVYTTLTAPISLQPGASYEFASQEVVGADTWYDAGPVTTTSDALATNSVYYGGTWIGIDSTNSSYVPPNFKYHF